jgi:AcrR family transcriptional regulator
MSYKRSSLMEERLAENRERILRAARQLVAKGGFREAQVSAVAAVAGLSTGAIYRYFPSKADLFVEVLGAAVKHEIGILGGIAAGPGTATQRLGAAVESFARRALEGPHLAYAFIAEPADPEVDVARIRDRQAIAGVFKTIVRDGIARGEFPQQNLDVSAACVLGAFTEALVGPIAPTAKATQDKERLVQAITQFCVRAVTGRVNAPAKAGGSGKRRS